eukprot:m.140816 g.140816  ORF g.140816 m.140816 type:complete len:163 (+) comp38329_c0_seq2:321-809(+)
MEDSHCTCLQRMATILSANFSMIKELIFMLETISVVRCFTLQFPVDTCEVLLEVGADIHADQSGKQPIHRAARKGCDSLCKLLLDRGANLAAKTDIGWQSLHFAATKGHTSTCSLLLERGPSLTEKDCDGRCPLLLAAINGRTETCALLLQRNADIRSTLWI